MTQNQKFSVKPPSRLEAIAHHAVEKKGDCDHQRGSCSDSGTAATPADAVFGSDSRTRVVVPQCAGISLRSSFVEGSRRLPASLRAFSSLSQMRRTTT